MSLSLVSLSSGSRGNCILIFSETTCVIIDAGIPHKMIQNGLKLVGCHSQKQTPSVLITHAHGDHVGFLDRLSDQMQSDVFCCAGAYTAVDKKMRGGTLAAADGDFFVGDLTVSPFSVSHDLPCVGYSVYNAGKKISVITDTGCVTGKTLDALMGSDIVFLESNHDEQMLKSNPSYPDVLKRRILSGRGHLSNADSAAVAVRLASSGTRQIVLGHLSEENNYPELAYSTVSLSLRQAGIKTGTDIHIDIAGFGRPSKVFRAE